MVVFFESMIGVVAVPESQIYNITQTGYYIDIAYNNGDIEFVDDFPVQKITNARIKYSSIEKAEKVMLGYFRSLNQGVKAYKF